jgi:hypothetical protein
MGISILYDSEATFEAKIEFSEHVIEKELFDWLSNAQYRAGARARRPGRPTASSSGS